MQQWGQISPEGGKGANHFWEETSTCTKNVSGAEKPRLKEKKGSKERKTTRGGKELAEKGTIKAYKKGLRKPREKKPVEKDTDRGSKGENIVLIVETQVKRGKGETKGKIKSTLKKSEGKKEIMMGS